MPITLTLIPISIIIYSNDDCDDDDVVDGDDYDDTSNVPTKPCAYWMMYTTGMWVFIFSVRMQYRSSLCGGEWTYLSQDRS